MFICQQYLKCLRVGLDSEDEELMLGRSKSTSEDVDDADEGGRVPLDGDGAVDFVVPEAGAWDVESAVGFLHDDTVGDELEVFVDGGDGLEDLSGCGGTSSHIWLVQIWASFTL